jgi:hypothetical protein
LSLEASAKASGQKLPRRKRNLLALYRYIIAVRKLDPDEFDPYFPLVSNPDYDDVVYCLESLYFDIVTAEEEYEEDRRIFAMCPAEHGVVEVKLDSLRDGSQCCKKCSQEKQKMTMVTRYGVENASHSKVLMDKAKATNLERYGVENAAQSEAIKEKKKQACLENWGVDHPMKTEELKEKKKQTTLEKYGVENPMQDKEVQERNKATCMENFGVEYTFQSEVIRDKIKATNMERLGVEYPFQSEKVLQKFRENSLKKWGTEHPMQHPEVFQRMVAASLSYKSYIFPSGKEGHIQGYENFCLDDLFKKEDYSEEDVTNDSSQIPEIWYFYENKHKRYYPDIFIISENRIIEVKSEYTFKLDNEKNVAKAKSCIKLGYEFEFRIYDAKGNLTRTVTY